MVFFAFAANHTNLENAGRDRQKRTMQNGVFQPSLTALACAAIASFAHPAWGQGQKAAKSDASPPPAQVRLLLVAPSPSVEWTYRIDNAGDKPVRIPADVR